MIPTKTSLVFVDMPSISQGTGFLTVVGTMIVVQLQYSCTYLNERL